jgi:hypothetical protein
MNRIYVTLMKPQPLPATKVQEKSSWSIAIACFSVLNISEI